MTYNKMTLADIAKLRNENIKDNQDSNLIYISTANMNSERNGINLEDNDAIGKSGKRFYNGDVLVSNIRPYFKKIWKADRDGLASADVLNFIPIDESHLDKTYLYYLLSADKFFDYMTATAKGTKMPRGDKKAIKKYKVPSFTLAEQKETANILSSFDDKIENNNAIIANLEEQAQAIFKSWFVDFEPFQDEEFVDSELGRIPSGWKVVRFDELIDFKNGYSFKSKELNNEQLHSDDLKVFKMGDIKVGGGINPNKTKSWVTREYVRKNGVEHFIAKKGLLLMCMTDMKNNVRLLGHTALINSSDEYIINQRVGMIKPKTDSGITSSFLYVLTNNEQFLNELRSRANSGVQVNLSTKEIKNSLVILPPANILNHFNQISDGIANLRFNLEKQNEKLNHIRDTLLPKLMSGEIRVGNVELEKSN